MNFKLLPSKYNIDLLRRINAYLCFMNHRRISTYCLLVLKK